MGRKEELELLISNGIIKDIAKIIIKYANPLLSEINCYRCTKNNTVPKGCQDIDGHTSVNVTGLLPVGKLHTFSDDDYSFTFTGSNVGQQLISETPLVSKSWSIDGCDTNSLICSTCGSYYMLCSTCCGLNDRDIGSENLYKNKVTDPPVHLCQFLGGSIHRESTFSLEKPADLETVNSREDIDEGIIEINGKDTFVAIKELYSVEDQNIFYANLKDLNHYLDGSALTGPDGGDNIYWKCHNCDHMFCVSDK